MSQWVSNATEVNFEAEVLERSKNQLVIVDFWADWCQPCKTLTPRLEQVVEQNAGSVHLVKVNVDQAPALAGHFGIRSIPAIKFFQNEALVAEFTGVTTKQAIQEAIDRFAEKVELTGIDAAKKALQDGDYAAARTSLEALVTDKEIEEEVKVLLAKAWICDASTGSNGRDQASAYLDEIPEESPHTSDVKTLRMAIDMLAEAAGADQKQLEARLEIDHDDHDATWGLAGVHLVNNRYEEALDLLLTLLQRSRQYRDDGARRAMVAIFDLLTGQPGGDDLARSYRRQMQVYL